MQIVDRGHEDRASCCSGGEGNAEGILSGDEAGHGRLDCDCEDGGEETQSPGRARRNAQDEEKTIQGLIGDLDTTQKDCAKARAEVEAQYQSLKSEFDALEQVTTDMRRCELHVLAEMDKLEVSCQQLECDMANSSEHARKETKHRQGLPDTMMWQKLQIESDLVREQDDNADIRREQPDAAERLHISTSQLFWIKKTIKLRSSCTI